MDNEVVLQEKRRNSKFVWIIALSIILIVITSVFLGTLSKYLTEKVVTEDASVAKFDLNVSEEINLFKDSYTNVEASDGRKIIAPGTSGSYKFKVSGTSEVAYSVSAEIEVQYSDEWKGYEPLRFSLDEESWLTMDEFEEELSNALKSEVINPNQPYESKQTIYWLWPLYVSDGEGNNDSKDTAMGEAATEATAPTVTIEMTVTAAQVE